MQILIIGIILGFLIVSFVWRNVESPSFGQMWTILITFAFIVGATMLASNQLPARYTVKKYSLPIESLKVVHETDGGLHSWYVYKYRSSQNYPRYGRMPVGRVNLIRQPGEPRLVMTMHDVRIDSVWNFFAALNTGEELSSAAFYLPGDFVVDD